MTNKIVSKSLNEIRIDGGTQSRTGVNQAVISEYAESMLAGAEFPPIDCFWDGSSLWLASGFHRYFASKEAGLVDVRVVEHIGTRRDAVQYSLSANSTHGLRRTTEDKRRAVRMALEDAEWSQLSDREIARLTATSHPFVGQLREAMNPTKQAPESGNASTQESAHRREDNTKSTPAPTPRADQLPGNVSTHAPAEQTAEAGNVSTDDNAPTLAEIADEQQREIERLQADVQALQSDDQRAETLKARRMLDNAVRQQGEAMEKAKRAEEREAWTKRQLMRCGAAVGEADPTKIAAAVEALARKAKVAA